MGKDGGGYKGYWYKGDCVILFNFYCCLFCVKYCDNFWEFVLSVLGVFSLVGRIGNFRIKNCNIVELYFEFRWILFMWILVW